MTAGDSPSPTEEELEALGRQIRAYCPWSDARHVFDAMRNALRSARESARVATRERDELQAQIEDGRCCDDADRLSECGHPACVFSEVCEICVEQGEIEGRFEAQLTDRDRMIAGLRTVIAALRDYLRGSRWIGYGQSPDLYAQDALDDSHPIAAAFEARKEST